MEKRTPQQVLDAIDSWDDVEIDLDSVVAQVDTEIDAEMENTLRMTREQIEADQRAAGVDIESEKAKALEAREKTQRGEAPAPPKGPESGVLN